MIGPKLDARAYAILILVVVGVLVSANLIAQTRSSSEGQAMVASATESVAAATEQVAQSNAEIASAIRELAGAVREVGNTMGRRTVGGGVAGDEPMMLEGAPSQQGQEGVFEIDSE